VIELAGEVITLRTRRPDRGWQETRLWIVDDERASWLHSAGQRWAHRFDGDPVVEIVRNGRVQLYRAHATPGPHPRVHTLLRAKYGWADRWVRFISGGDEQTLAVRLDAL
jgi:hypothetical protein